MSRIIVTDVHLVQKGNTVVPERQQFEGVVVSTQRKVFVDTKPVAVEQDRVVNARPHVPVGGSFVTPPSNDGRLTSAGQCKLVIERNPAVCDQGMLHRCDDACPRISLSGRVRDLSPKLVLGRNRSGALLCNR